MPVPDSTAIDPDRAERSPHREPVATGRRVRLLVAVLAPFCGLLAAEVCVRLLHPELVDTALLRRQPVPLFLTPLTRPSSDPRLVYELQAGFDQEHFGVRVRVDADGMRVPDQPGDPSAGALRVALVGASTTFGLKVKFEDTYAARMQPLFSQALRRPVEIRCFAVPGYNAAQQLRLFETKSLPWQPNLVIWHYDHRDAFPALGPADPIALVPEYGDNPLHSALVKLLLRQRQAQRIEAARYDGTPQDLFETYIRAGTHYDRHLDALRSAGAQAAAVGVPIVCVVFDAFLRSDPQLADDHLRALHEPLIPQVRAAGFRVLDLAPRYLDVMRTRGWPDLREWWLSIEPLDGHPNAAGHAFLAQEITAFVAGCEELARTLAADPP